MADLYFACDWIVKREEIKSFHDLMNITSELGIRLTFGENPQGRATEEGYITDRFLIGVSSAVIYQDFLRRLPQGTGFTNWFPVSPEYYETQQQWGTSGRQATIQEFSEVGDLAFNSMLDGYGGAGWRNDTLREKITQGLASYYRYDWLVPLLSPDLTKTSDTEWGQKSFDSPLGQICLAAERLDRPPGHSIRRGKAYQNSENLYFQPLIARFFSDDEFERFLDMAKLEKAAWTRVSEDQYRQAERIMEHTSAGLRNFYLEIERMGRENDALLRAN